MQFAYPDAVVLKTCQSLSRILKLDCKVACIVVDTQALVYVRIGRAVRAHLFEELNGFGARLQIAQGFGLEA